MFPFGRHVELGLVLDPLGFVCTGMLCGWLLDYTRPDHTRNGKVLLDDLIFQ